MQGPLALAKTSADLVYTMTVKYSHVEDIVWVPARGARVPQLHDKAEVLQGLIVPISPRPLLLHNMLLIVLRV